MSIMRKLAAGAATTVLAACLATGAAQAQETSGGLNGTVTDAVGHPLRNAEVTVTFGPTNTVRHVTTDAQGGFSLRGLQPGGPYTVTADDAGHAAKTVTDIQVQLGSAYQLTVALDTTQEVVVRGSRNAVARTLQTGARSTFTSQDLATLPTLNRDIKDIARLNPFVTVDPTSSNALVIAGNSNRSNTFYVDGARISDNFGLNANGYPGQRQPIPFDSIQSLNVEIAPTDVQYDNFTGGLININTISGGNEFHGGGFYENDSNRLGSGQEIRDHPLATPFVFQEKRYGIDLNGPIVPNRLFFSFNYEHYGSQVNNSYGASDSTAINRVPGVTTAEVNQVSSILQTKYGFDPLGTQVTSPLPITDDRFFGKLTWQITNTQRLVFEIQDQVGVSVSTNDQSTSSRFLSYQSDWYNFDQNIRSYIGTLYSDWTPNFHTEISYTRTEQENISNSLAGNDFANFRVNLPAIGAQPGGSLFAGPNISRQANALTTLDQVARIRGTYTLGQHTILLGYERDQLDVFNLFVQNANGFYTFNSPTDLQNGNAASLTYANAFDNVKADGAANWGDVTHSFYIQDEWRLRPDLTFKVGLRAELYEQSDKPRNNPYFASQYGFSNQGTLDGDNVIEPRLGLNYHPDPTFTAYLGAGLYSGGDPNVWLSNDYTNTGNLLGQTTITCATPGAVTCNPALLKVNGLQVGPTALAANSASANAGTGIVNALDPGFEPPQVYKFSAGFQKTFNFTELPFVDRYTQFGGKAVAHNIFDNWTVHGDYLYQHDVKEPYWYDALDTIGTVTKAPDGRPVYDATRFAANAATGRLARANAYDLVLASTDKGFSAVYAVGLTKTFDWGLTIDATYSHTHSTEVNPGTSSVALSNYAQNAYSNPNNPSVSISNYNFGGQYKFNINYSRRIFGDNLSSIRIYATKRDGQPFSYTFQSTIPNANSNIAGTTLVGGSTPIDGQYNLPGAVAQRSAELLYVPKADSTGNVTATSDPIVQYGASFAGSTYTSASGQVMTGVAAFNQFLKDTGLMKYNGEIAPRNSFRGRSVTDADIEFNQEIPVFFPYARAKAEVYFDIFNVGNLINSNYGVLEEYGFPYFASDVVALNCQPNAQATSCTGGAANKYQYQSFTRKAPTITTSGSGVPVSLYALKIGIRYKF